jgi:leucine-zipper of insertion element IS481
VSHANARLTVYGRALLVDRIIGDQRPVAHVAAELGVSRQCAHRWVRRFREEGMAGLVDRSSRPHRCPRRTPMAIEDAVVALRRRERRGQDWIGVELGVPARTVSTILGMFVAAVVGCDQDWVGPVVEVCQLYFSRLTRFGACGREWRCRDAPKLRRYVSAGRTVQPWIDARAYVTRDESARPDPPVAHHAPIPHALLLVRVGETQWHGADPTFRSRTTGELPRNNDISDIAAHVVSRTLTNASLVRLLRIFAMSDYRLVHGGFGGGRAGGAAPPKLVADHDCRRTGVGRARSTGRAQRAFTDLRAGHRAARGD